MDLTNRQQLIKYLQSRGLYTKKSLGQNFLVDKGALDKIVAAAELSSDDCVIEVGPGLGTLTRELIQFAGKVLAVELDAELSEILKREFSIFNFQVSNNDLCSNLKTEQKDVISSHPSSEARNLRLNDEAVDFSFRSESRCRNDNLTIINDDILHTNITELTKDCLNYKVVANIPYYITSKILRFFLEAEKKPETIVLLTQKEVAERICAKPGDMSILSVSVQYYGTPEIIDIVPRASFFPAPEVDSAILRIAVSQQFAVSSRQPEDEPPTANRQQQTEFFRCVHIGFASRRKTLLNNLSSGYQIDKKSTLAILEKVGLSDKTRAQELSVEKWGELCLAIDFRCQILEGTK